MPNLQSPSHISWTVMVQKRKPSPLWVAITYNMPYPPPETVSSGEFIRILGQLRQLLGNLPAQLPRRDGIDSIYSTFLNFSLDEDILDKTGDEVATLGEQLEHIFGWQARTTGDGIIPIVERRQAICALLPIFEQYRKKYPNNNVLKKWVIDVALGAEKVFKIHQVLVCPATVNSFAS
jgi:hypothetical protein